MRSKKTFLFGMAPLGLFVFEACSSTDDDLPTVGPVDAADCGAACPDATSVANGGNDAAADATMPPCASFSLMTYNLAGLTHAYANGSPQPTVNGAASRAKSGEIDFFAAQEVTINRNGHTDPGRDMPMALDAALGAGFAGHVAQIQANNNGGPWVQYAAVRTSASTALDASVPRASLSIVKAEPISIGGGARVVQHVEIDAASAGCATARLHVLNTHLETDPAYGFDKVSPGTQSLIDWLKSAPFSPDILIGDFNLYPFDASVKAIEAAGYRDTCPETSALGPRSLPNNPPNPGPGSCRWTFTERPPAEPERHAQYDFVFVRSGSRLVCHASSADQTPAPALSDHFPLTARCTIEP